MKNENNKSKEENIMNSATKKMEYYDQIEICKGAFFGEDLFNVLLTVLMQLISDNELINFDIKDLVNCINDEFEQIPVPNIRP